MQHKPPSAAKFCSTRFGKIVFVGKSSQLATYMQRNGFYGIFASYFFDFLWMLEQGVLEHGTKWFGNGCCCFVIYEFVISSKFAPKSLLLLPNSPPPSPPKLYTPETKISLRGFSMRLLSLPLILLFKIEAVSFEHRVKILAQIRFLSLPLIQSKCPFQDQLDFLFSFY